MTKQKKRLKAIALLLAAYAALTVGLAYALQIPDISASTTASLSSSPTTVSINGPIAGEASITINQTDSQPLPDGVSITIQNNSVGFYNIAPWATVTINYNNQTNFANQTITWNVTLYFYESIDNNFDKNDPLVAVTPTATATINLDGNGNGSASVDLLIYPPLLLESNKTYFVQIVLEP